MLSSAENKICSAYKKNKLQQFQLSSYKTELNMKFFLLKNIKITIVSILIFISSKDFMLIWVKYEKGFITFGPGHWQMYVHELFIVGTVRTFDWGAYLSDSHEEGASVSCFKHVSFGRLFSNKQWFKIIKP